MNVVVVNNHMKTELGGSEIQCHILATGLTERGHNVTYVIPTTDCETTWTEFPYEVVVTSDNPSSLMAAILEAAPDVVYWRRDKKNLNKVATAITKRLIPFVFAVSHISNLRFGFGNPIKHFKDLLSSFYWYMRSIYELRALSKVTFITVLNPDLLSMVPHKCVRYIANSVPLDSKPFMWTRPYIVWVASIKPEKRPEEAIALGEILGKYGVDLLMVGEIQHKLYAGMMTHTNLPSSVHYLGKKSVEEVNGILHGCLFHIHTCLPEGFGNIFIQAWASGRPSISLGYDPGGNIEKYNLGYNAKNDKQAFKLAVVSFILDSQKREKCGRNAEAIAHKYFSTDRMVSEIEAVLFQSIALAKFREGAN